MMRGLAAGLGGVALAIAAAAGDDAGGAGERKPSAGATVPAMRPSAQAASGERPTLVIDAEEAQGRANNIADSRMPPPPGLGSRLEGSMPASIQVSGRDDAARTRGAPTNAIR